MALLGALEHIANIGQFVELGQGHAHQQEVVRWAQKSYALDTQALKIDLIGDTREDIRRTYDTYVERLDSLLLLNAIILPYALQTLQFSDQFVPAFNCPQDFPDDPEAKCIVARLPWLHTIWVYMVGSDLFIPFWAILLLFQVKRRLDRWLQATLEQLQLLRKGFIVQVPTTFNPDSEEELANTQQNIIAELGNFQVRYQDEFNVMWQKQCAPVMMYANRMLWTAASLSVCLTTFMVWIYLVNRPSYTPPYYEKGDHLQFVALSAVGLAVPSAYFLRYCFKRQQPVPTESWAQRARLPHQTGISLQPAQDSFPPRAVSEGSSPSTAPALASQATFPSMPTISEPDAVQGNDADSQPDAPTRRRSTWF